MAEPVRKITTAWDEDPGHEPADDKPGITLLRWVERPDGELEQVAMPLTPELFLNVEVGDQMGQGTRHSGTARKIADLLEHHFRLEPDVLVTFDLRHDLGPDLPHPGPDVSVIRGLRDRDAERDTFDVVKEGRRPCLIVEVVSPLSSRIRRTDLVSKVEVYALAGIPEYLILDRERRRGPFRLLGYRLDRAGRYQRIEPDDQGRVLSTTTGVWFQVSPEGVDVLLFDDPTGERLLTRKEEEELRKAAEERAHVAEQRARTEAKARKAADQRANSEAEARKTAEKEAARNREEVERLRAEIARLRDSTTS